jgi:hypothetical protein
MAMISYYAGTLVKWDEVTGKIKENPAATGLLKREYRGNYIHP